MKEIKKVAVLGSGVMGAAIAAHLANCGIPSIMLDIVAPGLSEADAANKKKRNATAEGAKAALLKAKPSPIYRQSVLDLIEVGNFDDDMSKISGCDWIVEVVKEDLRIKKIVFANAAKHYTPGTIISSNTSGIPIKAMAADLPDAMSENFLGTHFFNPPRYLHLMELIPGEETGDAILSSVAQFAERRLGKGVVRCKDTPNFIGNRIGCFFGATVTYVNQDDVELFTLTQQIASVLNCV